MAVEKIQATDSLNDGRVKLNAAIEQSNEAITKATTADENASQAVTTANSIQEQFNQVVIEGDSSVEAAQARVDADGNTYATLKERLDQEHESVTTQLAQTELNTKDIAERKSIFKKEIFKTLPIKIPDNDTIIALDGINFIYPQAFTIDWDNREIFVIYYSDGGLKHWVSVFDLDTTSYKTCFSVGNFDSSGGGEGIVVKTESDGNRYLYAQSRADTLGKYMINTLPERFTRLTPINEITIPSMDVQFNYVDGRWIVLLKNTYGDFKNRRNAWAILDDSFSQVGLVQINSTYTGMFDSPYKNYFPKHQAVTLANGKVILQYGGNGTYSTNIYPYSYQGIRVLDQRGNILDEGLYNHVKVMDTLRSLGFNCNIIEAEGAHTAPNGEVYTLTVHLGHDQPNADNEGIIIFKEFSTSPEAIDFSFASTTEHTFDNTKLAIGAFPRVNQQMINPINGQVMDTLDKLCDFMIDAGIPKLSFYSSNVTVKDIKGVDIPTATWVTLHNVNDHTIRCEYLGAGNDGMKWFSIYGESGARVQEHIPLNDLLFSGPVNANVGQIIPLYKGKSNYRFLKVEYAYQDDGKVVEVASDRSNLVIRDLNLSASTSSYYISAIEVQLDISEDQLSISQSVQHIFLNADGTTGLNKSNITNNDVVIKRVWGIN